MINKSKIRAFLDGQAFNPSPFIGMFFNPFYFSRRFLFKQVSDFAKTLSGGKLLDVGCGTKPYRRLFNVDRYDGLEYSEEHLGRREYADFIYDGHKFPFQDMSYDTVICNEVFEEVFNPDEFLDEIYRVLKVGGVCFMTVPFAWDEQEQPMDFARYTSFGLRSLMERHSFEIVSQSKTGADLSVLFQLGNEWVFKKFTRGGIVSKLITNVFFSINNVVGSILAKLLPGNADFYLNNIVIARRIR